MIITEIQYFFSKIIRFQAIFKDTVEFTCALEFKISSQPKGFDPNLRLSDSVLGKYESDLAVPRLTEAAALAEVLNVSLDYLAYGENCDVLPLRELSPEQVKLLADLSAYIRNKKRNDPRHENTSKITVEQSKLIARLIDEILH